MNLPLAIWRGDFLLNGKRLLMKPSATAFSILLTAGLLSLVAVVFLWCTAIPLGVPGEWTWSRIPIVDTNLQDAIWGGVIALLIAGVYLAFVIQGASRLRGCSRGETGLWLGGLILFAFSWLWCVQEAPPAEHRMSKLTWVLYYPGSSGYFFEARYKITETSTLLTEYGQWMSEGDVLHIGTHPPGLFVFYRGLIRLQHDFPEAVASLRHIQPNSVRDAFATIQANTAITDHPLTPADADVLWLAALLTQLCVASTVLPLFLLVRQDFGRMTAWGLVTLWPLMPAIAIFLPKSDALYPVIATWFIVFWRRGLTTKPALWGILAGVTYWFGMFLSLALIPIGVIAVLLTTAKILATAGTRARAQHSLRILQLALGTIAGIAGPMVFLRRWYGLNLPNVWLANFHNHAGFYESYPRTYWKWLLVNPVEMWLAIGAPVGVLVIVSLWHSRRMTWNDGTASRQIAVWSPIVVWAMLWLSGKNMGEAARLWIILMPFVLWSASGGVDKLVNGPGLSMPTRTRAPLACLVAIQAVVCVLTVMRVDGFHLGVAEVVTSLL